jgi:hypothetical protein
MAATAESREAFWRSSALGPQHRLGVRSIIRSAGSEELKSVLDVYPDLPTILLPLTTCISPKDRNYDERQESGSQPKECPEEHRSQDAKGEICCPPQRPEAWSTFTRESPPRRTRHCPKVVRSTPDRRTTTCRRARAFARGPDNRYLLEAASPTEGRGRHIRLATPRGIVRAGAERGPIPQRSHP